MAVAVHPVPERLEVAGEVEALAYERSIRDHDRAESDPSFPFWFDEAAADRAVAVISEFRHTKGRWTRERWQWVPWQRWAVRELYGWKREDGTRRFRWAYIAIPRKNGKSEFAAANALYLQVADGEDGAEVYSAATKKDQARIVWSYASEIVRLTPSLKRKIRSYRAELKFPDTNSTLQPLGSDADTLDGLNPHGLVIDELHAHRDRGVLDVLQTATGARDEPLGFIITTAGQYDPEGIGWLTHRNAESVLRGEVEDESLFVFITQSNEGDEPNEPESWKRANPSVGYTVQEDYLESQAAKAVSQASFMPTFERYHLNRWVHRKEGGLDMRKWGEALPDVPDEDLVGRPCFGAVDLSSKVDLTAWVLVWPLEDGSYAVRRRVWIPEETIEQRSREDRVPYGEWARRGLIDVIPGEVILHNWIEAAIREDLARWAIERIHYDPWNAEQVAIHLQEDGATMVEMRQGFASMNEPSKELERLVSMVPCRVRHGDDPILTWSARNLTFREDPAGNLKPDKQRSTEKIDPMVALIMAIGAALRGASGPSNLEDHGVRYVGG